MTPSATGACYEPPPFACPRCHGSVDRAADAYSCGSCSCIYPVVAGVPDFRVGPDPWIGIEEDRVKALALLDAARGMDLEGTVRAYWAMTPETSHAAGERFIAHVLRAEARSREWLLGIDGFHAEGGPWLDLGCGSGDLLVAAGGGPGAVGVDLALRWLVVARRRLEEAGVTATLVCANAEHLPFAQGSFSSVQALGLVEHCRDKAVLFGEIRRALRAGGRLRLRTVNRFSILREPHVGVWGVGYLPHAWADRYVRWWGGQGYLHHWPEGSARLERDLREAGFEGVEVRAARLLASEVADRVSERSMALYRGIRELPLGEPVLRKVGPMLEIGARVS